MNIGERVIVDAAVMGDGEYRRGWVADVYEFARETFVEVKFFEPAADGTSGCVVNNLGMIRKEVVV